MQRALRVAFTPKRFWPLAISLCGIGAQRIKFKVQVGSGPSHSERLWPLAGGKDGSCRSAGMNWGAYDEFWSLSEFECQSQCITKGAGCLAYEYADFGDLRRCELHKEPITHTLPMGGHRCRIKPGKAASFEGLLPKEQGSHLPAPPLPPLLPAPIMPQLPPAPSSPPHHPHPPRPPTPPSKPPPSMPPPRPPSPPPDPPAWLQHPCVAEIRPSGDLRSCSQLAWSDLTGAPLAGATLEGTDLRGTKFDFADLSSATFFQADLTGALLRGAILDHADLTSVTLQNADFRAASLRCVKITSVRHAASVDFRNANLTGAAFTDSSMPNSKFAGATLSHASVEDVVFTQASFSPTTVFFNSYFIDCFFMGAAMRGVVLDGAQFDHPRLQGADLSGASIRNAVLTELQLQDGKADGAVFDGSVLHMSDFSRASLIGASFRDVELQDATFTGAWVTRADFLRAKGVERVIGLDHTVVWNLPALVNIGVGATLSQGSRSQSRSFSSSGIC